VRGTESAHPATLDRGRAAPDVGRTWERRALVCEHNSAPAAGWLTAAAWLAAPPEME